jgi:hypothetical protein
MPDKGVIITRYRRGKEARLQAREFSGYVWNGARRTCLEAASTSLPPGLTLLPTIRVPRP